MRGKCSSMKWIPPSTFDCKIRLPYKYDSKTSGSPKSVCICKCFGLATVAWYVWPKERQRTWESKGLDSVGFLVTFPREWGVEFCWLFHKISTRIKGWILLVFLSDFQKNTVAGWIYIWFLRFPSLFPSIRRYILHYIIRAYFHVPFPSP